MSDLEEKLRSAHFNSIPGPARRQLKTLVEAWGYKNMTRDRVELHSRFGEVSVWEPEGPGRAMDSWWKQVK